MKTNNITTIKLIGGPEDGRQSCVVGRREETFVFPQVRVVPHPEEPWRETLESADAIYRQQKDDPSKYDFAGYEQE